MSYIPLFVKSEYSLLESTASIESLVNAAKEFEFNGLAVTDNGNMYGAVKFYKACKKNNIKPIMGLHIKYVVNEEVDELLLYATNNFGYTSLMKISSAYMISGKPLDLLTLEKYSTGLIALTPGNYSVMYNYARRGEVSPALNRYELLKNIFGNVFIGITLTTTEDRNHIDYLYEYFSKVTKDLVALQPVFYINPSDVDAYRVLKSISNNAKLVDLNESEHNSYFLSEEEIQLVFKHQDLIDNTYKFYELCDVEISFDKILIPKYDESVDANTYLYGLAFAGLKKRGLYIPQNLMNIYVERLKYEYNTIVEMGFADYFLIVWDYIKYAKKHDIFVGPGRGSAGASLISYCLGITDVDPIKYNLLFERFLNKERITMPDIDIDFPDDKRGEVIEYVAGRYGKNRVAHIAAFATFQIKLAIADVAKVIQIDSLHLDSVKKIINKVLAGLKPTNQPKLSKLIEENEEFLQLMDEYDDINRLLSIASKIQDLPRNVSTHAAGIIITKNELVNYTGLCNGLDGIYQTQLEASDLESLGLLKMDFLGLKNLSNIKATIDMIKLVNPSFQVPKEENDPNVYKMMARGDLTGLFQLESAGMKQLIVNLRTSSFNDLVSAIALYRPGPMDMINHFINCKFGRERVSYPHPSLREILQETYGVIVYQEQIMMIAVKFAGYSLGRADILRRAVSKKKKDVLEREREYFITSSVNIGYDQATAEEIYDYIERFASYGFNKAHSVAYAKLSYLTAYLKYYYPVEYMTTLMSNFIGATEDIKDYTKDLLRRNISIVNPDVNESTNEFINVNNTIVYPLTMIKGLGEVKAKDIISERLKGKFKDFKDFVIRTKDILPINVVHNLIYAGALDSFGLTKKTMIENASKHIMMLDYELIPGIISPTYTDEEYGYSELINFEKEALGFNLKYSFIKQYSHYYKEQNISYIKDIKPNQYVKILGSIKNIKQIKTKKGDLMAFITLEDDAAKIDVTVFPNLYSSLNNIKNGIIVIIKGKVDFRNELQLVADEITII